MLGESPIEGVGFKGHGRLGQVGLLPGCDPRQALAARKQDTAHEACETDGETGSDSPQQLKIFLRHGVQGFGEVNLQCSQ